MTLRRTCMLAVLWTPAAAALGPENVLLVYNSRNAESQAVRDAYIAARPGVLQLDLNDPAMPAGSISRADYLARVHGPIRDFINGVSTGTDLSQQVMVILTTRGLPARILSPAGGADEFQLRSAWASVESELTLLQQDLEMIGSVYLPRRYNGVVYNPYWMRVGETIDSFSRAGVKTQQVFTPVPVPPGPEEVWLCPALTPGGIYLVCRLDAAPTPGGKSALQNIQALIARSQSLVVDRCGVQALFDEYAAPPPQHGGFELDNLAVPPLFPARNDFDNAAAFLSQFAFRVTHDKTFTFITGPRLADQSRRVFALGTYGTNHNINNWGESPPGGADYAASYVYDPAAVFIAYESWSGTSIYTGGPGRGGQGQVLDFIARGGSFTVGSVMEPFAFAIPTMQDLLPALLRDGLTFAEAVYAAMPTLSWQMIPVGDPLARVVVVGPGPVPARRTVGCDGDANRDGVVSFADVSAVLANFGRGCDQGSSTGDADNDGRVNFADITRVLTHFGLACE